MKYFTLILFSVLFFGCPKDDEPCTTCPQTDRDTLITVEQELADGEQPAVSPDGSKIAFVRNGDIWVMDTSGANQKRLTNSAETDIAPRWKPDGSTIGFVRVATGEYNKGIIFTIPASGGGSSLLVENHFVADSFVIASSGMEQPVWDWSPTGENIALIEQQGENTLLKVVSLNNDKIVFSGITYNYPTSKSANRSHFVWSQSDSEIVFIRQGPSGLPEIVLLNLQDGRTIIDTNYQIAFSLCRQPRADKYAIVRSFGSVVIKNFRDSSLLEYFVYAGGGLKWSFDGNNLLFHVLGRVDGPFGYTYSSIGIFNFKRNKQYPLTNKGDIGITNYFFEWSQKENEVFFERYKNIYKVMFCYTK